MLKNKLDFIKDVFFNIFFSKKYKLFYIVENANWSIYWDGKYITENLNNQDLIKAKISSTHIGLRNKILHFGSANTLISQKGIKKTHPSNKIILTWFHIAPDDKRIEYIPELNKKADLIHTSCNLTKVKLIKLGLEETKIIVIPLGIDLNIFKPYSKEKKDKIKKELNLPKNKIVVGSFQKDGEGWKEGLRPKLVKGPDIFCNIIEKLSEKYSIHVLLTGPARGYVKKRLEKSRITYTYRFLKNYPDIVDFYNVLDLYLITSREEGGPKAILESMACSIPVISTSVGMAPDIINTSNGTIINSENIYDSAKKIGHLIVMKDMIKEHIESGQKTSSNYDWKIISKEYCDRIYSNFII